MASDELRRCVRVDEMANVLRAQDRQAGRYCTCVPRQGVHRLGNCPGGKERWKWGGNAGKEACKPASQAPEGLCADAS